MTLTKQEHSRSLMRVKVIEATSFAPRQNIVTLVATYPRIIHAELKTHGLLCTNSASSRAIPIAKMLEMVRRDTFVPWHWKRNAKGMAGGEYLPEEEAERCRARWLDDAERACQTAEYLAGQGLLKGLANRVLEPFSFIQTLITTRIEYLPHFMHLRNHPMAEDHFRDLARAIGKAVGDALLGVSLFDGHHLPYVTQSERAQHAPYDCAIVSAARCRRVSYYRLEDGAAPSFEDDLAKGEEMLREKPQHASPFEHQAIRSVLADRELGGRLALPGETTIDFVQARKYSPDEFRRA